MSELISIVGCSECGKSMKDVRPERNGIKLGYVFCVDCTSRRDYIQHLNDVYNAEDLEDE